MSLFYILLLLTSVIAVAVTASAFVIRRNRASSRLLREGRIDEALRLMPSYRKKELLAQRLIGDGQIAQGLHAYQLIGNHSYIQNYIHDHLQIPGKFVEVSVRGLIFTRKEKRRSATAELLHQAAVSLLDLKENVNAMNNPYVPESLKTDIRVGLDDGFYILWDTCHRLSLIETQRLPVEEQDLQTARDEMVKLIEISTQAQKEMGKLTLERDPTRMKLYQETFRRFSEQAREIRDARRALMPPDE